MKFEYKKAFTIIELIISMTIFFILVMMTYVPYNFYMNKVKVRNTIKEISQSLYEARNMAINWFANWTNSSNESNRSVWLYIDILNNPSELQFFSYPHSYTWSEIINNPLSDTNINLIKKHTLIEWMKIKSIHWHDYWLFFYDAITWNWKYFYYDLSLNLWDTNLILEDNNLILEEFSETEIKIDFSFKGADEWSPLYWKIKYLTNTNIVDY